MSKPIFYDPTQTRQKIVKHILLVVALLILGFIGDFILSLMLQPYFPTPHLPSYYKANRYHSIVKRISQHTASYLPSLAPVPSTGETNNLIDLYAFYTERDDAAFSSLKVNLNTIDVLVPEWLSLTQTGIKELNPEKATQTLNYVRSHRETLPISVLINNFNSTTNTWDSSTVSTTLSNPRERVILIQALISYVDQHQLDGISIDFENLDVHARQLMVLFAQELHPLLQERGAQLTINVPFNDDIVPYVQLAKQTDKLIIMAYDQHWANGDAGPIASINRYQSGLSLLTKQLSPNKVIIALANYGYDWLSGSKESTTLTWQESLTTMNESSGLITYDPNSLNPMFAYSDELNQDHQVWYLDATTAHNQIVIGRNQGIGSYALWRLGSEDPGLRKLINNHTFDEQSKPYQLEDMRDGYDIEYHGSGLLLRLLNQPITGSRQIDYDPQAGLITNESITSFPQPYVIEKYAPGTGKDLLLTFDDGPSEYTPQILDILKQYHVPASFFIIGGNAQTNPGTIEREYNEGHTIGSRTFSHPDISTISPQQFDLELNSTQRIIEAITDHSSFLFRPPYSIDIEPRDMFEAQALIKLNQLGYYIMGLDIDPNDWENPGVSAIVSKAIEGAKRGGHIVLLHDGGGDRTQTLQALPQIITTLQSQGYHFISADQLIGIGSGSIMPPIQGKEELLSVPNHLFVYLSSRFEWLIYYLFLGGIIIGLTRLIIVISLSLYHHYLHHRTSNQHNLNHYQPSVTVIVPAYNEGVVIIKTINNLLESDYSHFQIIIVDDGSSDNTLELARTEFGQHPQITILSQPNGGKASALNLGINSSSSDIVMIQDADTLFNPDVIGLMARHFIDPKVGAVAGYVRVGNTDTIMGRCQELEYMTSQNLDRRAYDVLNCITVVPGAIGAWRRSALEQVGGLQHNTLAEDCDLTIGVLRNGRTIVHEESAIARTEAPDTISGFIKQRFRRMFGILQVTWKHSDVLFSTKSPGLGRFALPNLIIFQLIFPLLAPLLDCIGLINIIVLVFHLFAHYSQDIAAHNLHTLLFYGIFVLIDGLITAITFILDHNRNIKLALRFPFQRLLYRFLMYWVGIKVLYTAAAGTGVGRNKLIRKGTATTNQ